MPSEILTANRLRDGAVVWLGAGGHWVERFAEAAFFDSEEAEAATREARDAERQQVVVGSYRVAVDIKDGKPALSSIKEQIRAEGPSVL